MKAILLKALVIITIFTSCNNDSISEDLDEFNEKTTEQITIALTQHEKDDLLFLREEEKLARDVYLYAYELYGTQIFKNIANSEQQHMNSVLDLLKKYNLNDSASEIRGTFHNPDLQTIYNSLIKKTSISLLEALLVGNTIEDLDINDISKNEQRSEKEDLLKLYSSLKCGSRNHLRNFNKQVEQNDALYIPVYISTNEFEAIVSTTNEQCGLQ